MEPEKTPGTELAPGQGGVPGPAGTPALGRGHEEHSDADELEMPRAKLVQFTSGEAQAEDKAARKDPGTLINSISKNVLGEFFVPIFKFTNFTCWNPRKKDNPNFDPAFEPGELVFSTSDRRDPRVVEGVKFGSNGEAPKVTKYMNFLCYFIGDPYPLVLSFSKTSLNAGKKLNTSSQIGGGDMFSFKYKLAVSLKENAGTKYCVLDVVPCGKATPEEFRLAESWYNRFHDQNIKVHEEAKQPDFGE
jgi:hypothetical protein